MTMSRKKYIYLMLTLLLATQLKAMEIIGIGAGAAAVFSAVMLKRLKTYPSSQAKETESDRKKTIKAELDFLLKCSDDVWLIIRAYVGQKYQVDIAEEMSQRKYPWSPKSPTPTISALEFSSCNLSEAINAQRFYKWNLQDQDFLKNAKGVIWAKVLHSEQKEDLKNCYLSWAITSKGLEYIHNKCQPFSASSACTCGGCFASSPLTCDGTNFNHFAMHWKPCARPEAQSAIGSACFATVDDHTFERGGTKLTVLTGGDKHDGDIYDMLSLKVPVESPKKQ